MQVPAKHKSHLWDKKKKKSIPGTKCGERRHSQNSRGATALVTKNARGIPRRSRKNPGKMRLYLVERRELQPELHLGHFRAAFGGLSEREAAAGGGCSAQSGERSIHSQGSSGGFKSQHSAGRAGKMETRGPAEPSCARRFA